MGNIDNKEKEFAEILKTVTRTARENKNTITKAEVMEAFSELDLDEKQLTMVLEYLKNHKIGVDEEAVFSDDDLTEDETNYLNDYLENLAALPKYTEGEKEAAAISALAGDKDAQSKLIEIYLPLVVDVAKMYSEQGVFLEDLIGEGNVALTKGVTMLDAMENIIEQNLAEDAGAQKVLKLVQEVADKAKELADDLRRKVTVKELMDETGWDEDKIRTAIEFSADNIEDLDSGVDKKKK